MKRIAIPGAMAAVTFYWVMKWFVKRFGTRPLRGIITIITVVSIAGLFGYLMIIRSGLFIELAERYDVDLMSRDRLWTFIRIFIGCLRPILEKVSDLFTTMAQRIWRI